VEICTADGDDEWPQLVSDEAGGAIITWASRRSGDDDIFAQKVDPSGTVLWETDGVAICTALDDQHYPQLVSDETGGAIITWQDQRSGADYDIYAAKSALPDSGQSQYVKTLGGNYSDHGGTITQTFDGGFVVGGRTDSFGEGDQDNLLTKFDSFGNHLWTRAVGYGFDEGSISIAETSDRGFVAFGWSESFWADREHLIAKFDESGNHLWTRTIRGDEPWWAYGGPVIEASDGGLVVFGSTNSFTGIFDLLLSKFDSTGAHLWTKILAGSTTKGQEV
jgi:hypothetical protein